MNEYIFQKDYTWARKVRQELEKARLLKSFEEATRIFTIAFKYGDQFADEMGRLLMAACLNYMYECGSESFREFFQEDTSYLLGAPPHSCNGSRRNPVNIEEAVRILETYLKTADPESLFLSEEDLSLAGFLQASCRN